MPNDEGAQLEPELPEESAETTESADAETETETETVEIDEGKPQTMTEKVAELPRATVAEVVANVGNLVKGRLAKQTDNQIFLDIGLRITGGEIKKVAAMLLKRHNRDPKRYPLLPAKNAGARGRGQDFSGLGGMLDEMFPEPVATDGDDTESDETESTE